MTPPWAEIVIAGAPRGKGRPRFSRNGHVYTDIDTFAYEARVAAAWRCGGFETIPAGVPVCVEVLAVFPIPRSVSAARAKAMRRGEILPTKRPDADNILKIVLDALNGLAWHDDAQVVEMGARKVYGATGEVRVRWWATDRGQNVVVSD